MLAGTLLLIGPPVVARPLERGNGPEPSTLDAHRCQEVACGNILRDLYEGLISEDADGRPIPGMAARWEISPDGLRWTFHLRENLRWSNGDVLDADQIVASFRRALDPSTGAPMAMQLAALDQAEQILRGERPPSALGVVALDAHTLVFQLSRPAPLERLLVLPLAYPVWLPGITTHGDRHTRAGLLVSNGAYQLHAWTPQANLRLHANPHFRDRVAIAEVGYHVTEDAAAERKRFEAGDLHITETVPPGRQTELRRQFGDALHLQPYLGTFWLGFNLTRPPFADNPALREALSLAVDREILTRAITGMNEAPAWHIVPPGIDDGYHVKPPEHATWTQAQRNALARQRYAEAGYSREQPLQIELRYNSSLPHRRTLLAVSAMWREVLGVQSELRNEEWKVFVQNRRQRVLTQVFRGGWIGDIADPINFLDNFEGDTALNWSGYDNRSYSTLLKQARAAADPATRLRLAGEAEKRLLQDHAVVPLYHYTAKHLVDPRLGGWQSNLLDRHPSRFLHWRDVESSVD